MAHNIGAALSLTLPTVSVTTGPLWAVEVNAALQALIDAVEAGVRTSTGLTVDSDLDMNDHSLLAAARVEYSGTPVTTGSRTSYVLNGDLYFNDGDGVAIQITSDGNLNAAGIGGIVGDYGGSNPAKVTYTDSLSTYIFTQDPGIPAKIDTGDIKLRQTIASANAITIKSPNALSAAYTMTLPPAVPSPADPSIIYALCMDGSGTVTANTSPLFTAITTLEADVHHGLTTLSVPAALMQAKASGNWIRTDTSNLFNWQHTSAAIDALTVPIQLQVGDVVSAVKLYCSVGAATSNLITCQLIELNMTGGTITTKSNADANGATTSIQSITLTGVTSTTVTTGKVLLLKILTASSVTNKTVYMAEITYSRP